MKKGEKITEKFFSGKKNNIIIERRKVEVFKSPKKQIEIKQKTKQEFIPFTTREPKKYEQRFKTPINDKKLRKKGEKITKKIFPGKNNTIIAEKRVVEVFKCKNNNNFSDLKGSKDYERLKNSNQKVNSIEKSKDEKILKKKGEKITKIIFPGKSNTLVLETRKVEVFKNKRKKY